jgi:hypothetical protein
VLTALLIIIAMNSISVSQAPPESPQALAMLTAHAPLANTATNSDAASAVLLRPSSSESLSHT